MKYLYIIISNLRNRLKRILFPSKLVRLLSIALVIFSSEHANATVIPQKQSDLEKRIELVREKVLQNNSACKTQANDLKEDQLAQWYNWPNWPNWNNWGNWGNWPNWYNY